MSESPTVGEKLAAEGLGTFVLVIFGVGAALMSGGDYVVTGLSFGLAVLVMAAAVGRVSGGHFNPAVSVGAAVAGRVSWRDAGLYALVQLAGALVAGLTLWVLMQGFPGFDSRNGFGQNSFGAAGSGFAWWAAFGLETLMTAIFLWVILAVTDVRNDHVSMAPLAIGLTLAVIHFASMGATGTSVNPARSIGVGIYAGQDAISQLWLFILAPLLGGALAGSTYSLMFGRGSEPVPGSGVRLSRRASGARPAYPPPTAHVPQWTPETAPTWSPPAGPSSWPQSGTPGGSPPGAAETPHAEMPFPPAPSEPYWSQQLPGQWGIPAADDDDDDGHTQIRRHGGP